MAKITSTKLPDKSIATKIASEFLGCAKIKIKFIGKGSNNKNYLANSKDREIVVKLSFAHKEYKALEDYQKEKWCIERSSEKGVSGPTVLDVGRSQGRAYMIETFVPGISGAKIKNKLQIWKQLGKYAKCIHSIKASGFGENLTNPKKGIFRGSWRKYLDYNIKSLTDRDKLIALKVITKEQSRDVKKIFQDIKRQKFIFGLNHGDISAANVLVDTSGKVGLLDWGCAEVHIIPHLDIMGILSCMMEQGRPTNIEFSEFLKGYGMSQKRFASLIPELNRLMLL
ncbi:aminoglycoside phosphotransferase family protein, partial [Candidatus Peregrinibacteria bacterium]|nr:aminoglycoside phosphotransferase family protein [Candidatus Peregrinibacteria bacterium]